METNWKRPQPAPKALWGLVSDNLPRVRHLGFYNPRNLAGTNTPSTHAEGRALDIGLLVARPLEKNIGDGLFALLIQNCQGLGLDHAIWGRPIGLGGTKWEPPSPWWLLPVQER